MTPPHYHYQAFGLNISSELELPSLKKTGNKQADVVIKKGNVSTSGLENPEATTPLFQCSENHLWLNINDIARFMVSHGNNITVDLATDADTQSVRLFLLGSCLGAILHQRGMLVLHGNAIRFGDHCVVFTGHSGHGKSTLAAAFHQRGHDILTDDVCAVNHQGFALPGIPQMKLWSDTLAKLEVKQEGLKKIRLQGDKFAYPVKSGFSDKPLPIKAVYILNTHHHDEFLFEPIQGMDKFLPLSQQTYRKKYLQGLALTGKHLQLCGKIAGQIHLTRITRPSEGFQLEALVQHIEQDLLDKGLLQ